MPYEYELLNVISFEQLRSLQHRYQGSRMYVPQVIGPDHPIARLIGYEGAKKLSAEFGGLLFPVTKSLLIRERNDAIRRERILGAPRSKVAAAYGLSARTIRRICQGHGLTRKTNHYGLRRRHLRAVLQGLELNDRNTDGSHPDDDQGA